MPSIQSGSVRIILLLMGLIEEYVWNVSAASSVVWLRAPLDLRWPRHALINARADDPTHNKHKKTAKKWIEYLFFSHKICWPLQEMIKSAVLPIRVLLSERFLLTKTTVKGFLSHPLTRARAECSPEHSYLCSHRVCVHRFSFMPGRVITGKRVRLHGRVFNSLILFSGVFWHSEW